MMIDASFFFVNPTALASLKLYISSTVQLTQKGAQFTHCVDGKVNGIYELRGKEKVGFDIFEVGLPCALCSLVGYS